MAGVSKPFDYESVFYNTNEISRPHYVVNRRYV